MKLALEVAYVGNKGVNNQTGYNLNASFIPGSGNAGRPLFAKYGRSTNAVSVVGTSTWYNGLQLILDRKVSNGFFVTIAYTFSKGLNYAEDNDDLATSMSVALNKGRMSDNRTHVFTQSYIWALPFGKGKRWAQSGPLNWVAGCWESRGCSAPWPAPGSRPRSAAF